MIAADIDETPIKITACRLCSAYGASKADAVANRLGGQFVLSAVRLYMRAAYSAKAETAEEAKRCLQLSGAVIVFMVVSVCIADGGWQQNSVSRVKFRPLCRR